MRPAPKRYTEEFKQRAVDLVINSDQSLKEVSQKLGVTVTTLRAWKTSLLMHGKSTEVIAEPRNDSLEELQRVVRRLREQLAHKDQACEILKKAIAICSEQQGITNFIR